MKQNELIALLSGRSAAVDPMARDPNGYTQGMDPYTAGRQVNWGSLPGADNIYSYDPLQNQERVDMQKMAQYLQDNGMSWMQGSDPASQTYGNWVQGPDGQAVADSGRFGSTNEERFKIAAILAAAGAGGAAYSAAGAGAGAGAGGYVSPELVGGSFGAAPQIGTAEALAGGGIGTMGSIPSAAGLVDSVPLAEMGQIGGGLQLGQVAGLGAGGLGAMGGGGGVGASDWLNIGGNLFNGYMGSKAAGDAADAQLQAGQESNALMREMWQANQQENAPLVALRNAMLPGIQGLATDPSTIVNDPGYKFGMDQGVRAMDNSASARGRAMGGEQAKALTQFGQDYAGTKLDQSMNRLIGAANLGQVGSQNNMAGNMNYGNNVANNLQNMGNVRGSSYMGQAGAWTGAANNALNNYQNQWWMRNVFGGGG